MPTFLDATFAGTPGDTLLDYAPEDGFFLNSQAFGSEPSPGAEPRIADPSGLELGDTQAAYRIENALAEPLPDVHSLHVQLTINDLLSDMQGTDNYFPGAESFLQLFNPFSFRSIVSPGVDEQGESATLFLIADEAGSNTVIYIGASYDGPSATSGPDEQRLALATVPNPLPPGTVVNVDVTILWAYEPGDVQRRFTVVDHINSDILIDLVLTDPLGRPSIAPDNAGILFPAAAAGSTPTSLRFTMIHAESDIGGGPGSIITKHFDIAGSWRHELHVDIDGAFSGLITKSFDLAASFKDVIRKDFDIVYDIKATNTLKKNFDIVYSLFDENTKFLTNYKPIAIVGGVQVELESFNVNSADGQYAWVCDMQLLNVADYVLFTADKSFSVLIGAETYNFIIDGKSLSRSGMVAINATVRGISKVAMLAEPRARPLTIDLSTQVYTTVELLPILLGDLFGDTTWEVIHWAIPAGRIGSTGQTPLRVLQQIAAAAGAVVMSDPDGHIRIRYDFPVSVPAYGVATADHVYNDIDDRFSSSEQPVLPQFANALRILDSAANASGDSGSDIMEFTQDENKPANGFLRIYPRPWRNNFVLDNSLFAGKAIISFTGGVAEFLSEVVEVVKGEARVSKPIYSLSSVDYIDRNLGTPTHAPYDEQILFSVAGETLARINYFSRYLGYNVFAFLDAQLQIVAYEPDNPDTPTSGALVDIMVQRGNGSRRGDDIIDPLIGSVSVAIQRGRNELDRQTRGLQDVDIEARYRDGLRTGQIAQFFDSAIAAQWFGKIEGITHTASRAGLGHVELITSLNIKRPSGFYDGA